MSGRPAPARRARHAFAADPAAGLALLHGGLRWGGEPEVLGDGWRLTAGGWDRLPDGPGPRHRAAMTFDPGRGRFLLFGGQDERFDLRGDLWSFERDRWRRVRAGLLASKPAPRCGHAFCFDPAGGRAVLFGGVVGGDESAGDTWELRGDRWRKLPAPGPPARRYAVMAWVGSLGGCVLHSGSADDAGRARFGDTWLLAGGR